MTHYADPTRCPDCRSGLTPGSTACPTCGLVLAGDLGRRLFATLTEADALLVQMRHQTPVLVTAGTGTPGGTGALGGAPVPPPPPLGPPLVPPLRPPGPGQVRGSSVPRILLGLGALCLLVAGLVFLAVTWSVLGVGGRTVTLVAFTLAAGAAAAAAARANLRAATESLGLVALGLTALDVVGARHAGWLGQPSDAAFATGLGLALVVASLAAVRSAAGTPVGAFVAGEVVASVAGLVACVGLASQSWADAPTRSTAAVLLAAGLTAGAHWVRTAVRPATLSVAEVGLGGVTVLAWLGLVATGVDLLDQVDLTVDGVWLSGQVWPLLVASGLAVVATLAAAHLPAQLAGPVRGLLATLAIAPVVGALVAPALDESATRLSVVLLLVALLLAVVVELAPAPWSYGAVAPLAATLVFPVVQALRLAAEAAARYLDVATSDWAGTPGGRLPALDQNADLAAPWLLVAVVAVGCLALGALTRSTPAGRTLSWELPLVAAAALTAAAGTGTLLLLTVPVWVVLAVLLAAGTAFAVAALVRDDPVAAAVGAATLTLAVAFSTYDEVLALVALGLSTVLVTTFHLRTRQPVAAEVAGALLPALVGGLVWTGGVLSVAPEHWRDNEWIALWAMLPAAVLVLLRPALPSVVARVEARIGLELGAALTWVVLLLTGVEAAPSGHEASWAAVYLTVAGTTACLLALLHPDRRQVGWLGGALLVLATWCRLAALGVDAPEPYTLPAAVALLVVGGWHLYRHPGASTLRALGAGLGLALVPSLLWVLEEPVSLRGLLLGLACVALVLGGLGARWSAPLLYGATVGALVVLREAAPYVGAAVPRWALIGVAGAVMIALGVTWERRVRDARAALTYVQHLR